MAQESSMSRSGALASDWYFLGRVRPLEEIAAALDALTPEDVSAACRRPGPDRRPHDPDARADGASSVLCPGWWLVKSHASSSLSDAGLDSDGLTSHQYH